MSATPTAKGMSYATCRCCDKMEDASRMIKYGVRHYAHAECGLKKWGAQFFARLQDWQLRNFPAIPAHQAGLLDELQRRIEALS